MLDPVDDSRILLRSIYGCLDSVLEQREEHPILLDRVGMDALEGSHRQLGDPVRQPLAVGRTRRRFASLAKPFVFGVFGNVRQLKPFRLIGIKEFAKKFLSAIRHRLEILGHFARSLSPPS